MSKKTDKFENDLSNKISQFKHEQLTSIPAWMTDLGIARNLKIISSRRVGASGGKTDIIVTFDNNMKLKISAKMSSADYFGNWYSHTRLIKEFGEEAFFKLTKDCTEWANEWVKNPNASLFIGVSICFGKRTGNTAKKFIDIFTYEDIKTIVAGNDNSDQSANCLYISNDIPNSLEELISNLKPINHETISQVAQNFQIAYRPINPMKEFSNRGKCCYSQFILEKSLEHEIYIDSLDSLRSLGYFDIVENNSINHNRILKGLDSKRLIIKRISKEESKAKKALKNKQ
ncbi:hypothetical protein [Acinetobacter shaoyimingii]|uniref:hypothetical protein n=1 Tax=Acinetobacter shaoyimingii TaxID=2715164 RepID=UPI0018C8BF4C|nr:hypothetical protein [Acinetobacter shaoyimingii]